MWKDVKKKFHIVYFIIIGLTVLIAPWDMYSSSHKYKGTVYSLIVQPPHVPYKSYTVSIGVETLIVNVLLVSLIYGIAYLVFKKLVYKN